MAFPTTGVLDDFNRGDATPPSGSWSDDPDNGGANQLSISSNQLVSSTGESAGYWNPTTFTETEAFITIVTKGGNGDEIRLFARLASPNTAGADGYVAEWTVRSATDKAEIFRMDNTVYTQLGADRTFEQTNGDRFGFWADGTTLRFYTDRGGPWAEEFNETDSTYSAAGEIGTTLGTTVYVCDDFGGGETAAASSLFRQRQIVRGAI